jgi:mannonate dehydratase
MRIRGGKVVVCSPGRNFVTLLLESEDGLVGLGDATLNGRELAVVAYLESHVLPLLQGRDGRRIEETWQFLYRGAYWRRGPVTMAAIAAVDTALWDLKAKAFGVPLYQLLGGACRDGVTAYGHAFGADPDAAAEAAAGLVARGFRAVRVQCGVPGRVPGYGVAGSTGHAYEPAQRGHLAIEMVSPEAYLRVAPRLLARAREAVGPDVALVHDVHHRLRPVEAARLGKSLEPYAPTWMEDPTPAEIPERLRLIRGHTTVPIAIGEVFNTAADVRLLIEEHLIDHVRMTPAHAGGISHLRKIAAMAELHQVLMSPHGPSDISPVGFAAALHFDLAVHNLGLQEWMGHPDESRQVFKYDFNFSGGRLNPGQVEGLGVTFDEAAAAQYPYQQAWLPAARLDDGTVHDW